MKRFNNSFKLLKNILSNIMHPAAGLSLAVAVTVSALMLSACDNDEPDPTPVPPSPVEDPGIATSILLYAVASNNLAYDFKQDLNEIMTGAADADLNKVDVWVYSLTNNELPSLRHLVREDDGTLTLDTVKEYDRTEFSTDPARISQVIADYVAQGDSDRRGIIFWSHATGWSPSFSDHTVPATKAAPAVSGKYDQPMTYWYGADSYDGTYDYCDLLELDSAIPAGTFDFIWFDCCYMSAIEVLYQLRDKTPYIIAYPTEVAAEGMPYDLTIPHLAKKDYDILEAAEAMANYYLTKNAVVTIAVTDTSKLPALAAAAETAVTGERGPQSALQCYSRRPNGPFYDFGQYTRSWGATLGDAWDAARFEDALEAAVIYKAASDRGFDGKAINPENYSGVSCHYFEDYGTEESEYYKKLDWFRDVYTTIPEW